MEDIRAKCHELLLTSGEDTTRLFAPTFTQHILSVTGLNITSDSKNETADQVQNLTTAVFNEVGHVLL